MSAARRRRVQFRMLLLASVLLVQAAGCAGAPPTGCGRSAVPHPEVGGEILYSCFAPGTTGGQLFLLDVAAGRSRPLTSDGAWNIDAAWSPDGDRIAYQSTRDGRSDLYVMNLSDGSIRWLTGERGFNGYPSWSPDGRWIVFDSSRNGIRSRPNENGFYRDLYVVRDDGSGLHRLTDLDAVNSEPAWAPSGDRIAFDSNHAGGPDIFVVGTGGTGLEQLTHHQGSHGYATYPQWAPDGTRIVFDAAGSASESASIYWMPADGSATHRITDAAGAHFDAWPDWSPDGGWIAFTRSAEHQQLYVVSPDGTGLTQLTADSGDKVLARWRPR